MPLSSGFADITTSFTSDASKTDPNTAAIAQVVQLDPRCGRTVQDEQLIIRCTRLMDRKFLNENKLSPNSSALIQNLRPRWTIQAATAVLIDEWHVLMAAHSVIPSRLDEAYLVFGRTPDSDDLAAPRQASDPYLRVGLRADNVAKLERIVAMYNPQPREPILAEPDWAIVRLDRRMVGRATLPLQRVESIPATGALVYTHPLGCPMQTSTLKATPTLPKRFAQLEVDFGSGGSGSPLVVDGKTVGLVSGNARFTADMLAMPGQGGPGEILVMAQPPTADMWQPTTLADEILSLWP